jgi:hypothetical protein
MMVYRISNYYEELLEVILSGGMNAVRPEERFQFVHFFEWSFNYQVM